MSDRWAKVAAIASAGFLFALAIFTYGLAVGRYQIWPFSMLQALHTVALSHLKYGEFVPDNRRHVAAPDAPRVRFAIHASELRAGGHYVFLGWDDSRRSYAAWLYDADGTLLHTWVVDYDTLDPTGPSNGSDEPHAFHVLADGSIVVGFDRGDVMARLDSCSVPLWIRPGIFHHAMEPAEDGSVWTWYAKGTPNGHYHYLENFNPKTGEHIKGLALIEDIIRKSELAATILAVTTDYQFCEFRRDPEQSKLDIFHPNDIEEVPASFAEQSSLFEAGDLMLSFRSNDLVVVIDDKNHSVKWWSHGPWRFQHDPDFRSDGKISIYDNNPDRGNSRILTIDPETGEISNELSGMTFSFYSEFRGKHQYLPNGNVIIVVPEEGRILELTKNGRKVLEFNNVSPFGDKYNEEVQNAIWLEPDTSTKCPRAPTSLDVLRYQRLSICLASARACPSLARGTCLPAIGCLTRRGSEPDARNPEQPRRSGAADRRQRRGLYESNNFAALTARLGQDWRGQVTYTIYSSPNDVSGTAYELALAGSYRGSNPIGGLAPQLKIAKPTGRSEGVYTTPGLTLFEDGSYPLSLAPPLTLGGGFDDYYGTGTGTTGFVGEGRAASARGGWNGAVIG